VKVTADTSFIDETMLEPVDGPEPQPTLISFLFKLHLIQPQTQS